MTTLRAKVLLLIVLLLIVSLVATFFVSRTILDQGFHNLEERAVNNNLYRAETALEEQIAFLANTTRDYAHWDDTFDFIESRNVEYIDTNIQAYFYESFEIDLVVFLNVNREIVYSRAFDPQQQIETDIPAEVLQQILSTPRLLSQTDGREVISGLLSTERNILVVASVPILPTNLEASPDGTLIFGRYLESDEVEDLTASIVNDVKLYDLGRPNLPTDVVQAQAIAANSSGNITIPISNNIMYSYRYLNNIDEMPSFFLRVSMVRDIHLEGLTTQTYFVGAVLVIGALLCSVSLILLDRLVLSRIATLGRRIREITPDDHERFINFDGDDEIAQLAQQFNRLLRDINGYHASLTQLNQELESRNAELRAEQENKDRFFAHLGHELRTPLSNIKLRMYLMKRQPERAVESVEMMSQLIDQVTDLIGDMVEMSRLNRGSISMERLPLDLYQLIRTIVKSVESYANNKLVRVVVYNDTASSEIEGDSERLKIALGNLVRFCVRSAEPNSEIAVRVVRLFIESKSWIVVRIEWKSIDTKLADLNNLLTPFFVATEADKTGTRMHLALSKAIVEMHKGRIRLEDSSNNKKVFIIRLPDLLEPTLTHSTIDK